MDEPAINGIIAGVRDITERKRVEEATLNSNKLLQTIITTALVNILFKDRELRYIGCNNIFALDVGVKCPEDLKGKDDYQLGPPVMITVWSCPAFLKAGHLLPNDTLWILEVTSQKGNGFYGQWCSPNLCEDLVGVIRRDGTMLMADEDSTFFATLYGEEMELCITEPDGDFRVATCHVMIKKQGACHAASIVHFGHCLSPEPSHPSL